MVCHTYWLKINLIIGLWFMEFNATGGQFHWWRELEDLEKTTDLSQVTDKLFPPPIKLTSQNN
jgi:hypothetical protein